MQLFARNFSLSLFDLAVALEFNLWSLIWKYMRASWALYLEAD